MARGITKEILSGSTGGRLIKVVAVASPGTEIHTASISKDEIFLYATNTDVLTRTLFIEFGGVTSPDDLIIVQIPSKSGMEIIVNGLVLTTSLVVTAYASVANTINIGGYVNRIS